MDWIDYKKEKPPLYKSIIVRKFYFDEPTFEIDMCRKDGNKFVWIKGGEASHWAEIIPPEENLKKKKSPSIKRPRKALEHRFSTNRG